MTPYEKCKLIQDIDFNFDENKNRVIRKMLNKLGVEDTSIDQNIYIQPSHQNTSYQIFYEIFLEKQLYNRDLQFFNKKQLTILKNIVRPQSTKKALEDVGFNQINISKDKSIFYLTEPDLFLTVSPERIKKVLNVEIELDSKNKFADTFIGYPVDNNILNATLILDKDFKDTPSGDFQTLVETSTAKEFFQYHQYLDIENQTEETLNLLVKAIRLGMTKEQIESLIDETVDFKERKQYFNSYVTNNVSAYINIFCDFRYRNELIDEIYKDMLKFRSLINNPPSLEKLDILNRLMPTFDARTPQRKKALSYFSTIYEVPEFVDIENYTYIANFQLSKEKLEKLISFIERYPDNSYEFQVQSITTEQLRILSTPQISMQSFNTYLSIFLKYKSIDTFSVLKYVKPDKQHPIMIEKVVKSIISANREDKTSKEKPKEKVVEKVEEQPKDEIKETSVADNTIKKPEDEIIEKAKAIIKEQQETTQKPVEPQKATIPTSIPKTVFTLDDIDDFDDFKDFKFL